MADNNFNQYSNNDEYYRSDMETYDGTYNMNTTPYANTVESYKALAYSFLLMTIALFVSAAAAIVTYSSGFVNSDSFNVLFYVAIFAELIVVFAASTALNSRNVTMAGILFFVYAICNGFTLAIIFVAFEFASIVMVFLATAAMFAGITAVAVITKKDLTVLGIIGCMGIIALLIVSFISMFFGPEPTIVTIIGLALFIGITAYDVQKIKTLANSGAELGVVAIFGALNLYLDFVNLFLKLLRLFGRRNN